MQQAQPVNILGKSVDLAMICCRANFTQGRQHHVDADNVRHVLYSHMHDLNSKGPCNESVLLGLNICCFGAGVDLLCEAAC